MAKKERRIYRIQHEEKRGIIARQGRKKGVGLFNTEKGRERFATVGLGILARGP